MTDSPTNNVLFAYQIGRNPTHTYFGTATVDKELLPGVFTGTSASWGTVAEKVRKDILARRASDSTITIIAIGRTGTIDNGYRLTKIVEASEPTLPKLITSGAAFKTRNTL